MTAAVAAVLSGAVAVPQASAGAPGQQPPPAMARADFSKCGYVVREDAVRLRTGPGSRYTVLGLLHQGDAVYALQARRGWYKVRLAYDSGSNSGTRKSSGLTADTTGWVANRYLRRSVCMRTD
ncbi:SH3 domain-containing protein [Streptomyces flaveolus]|uniref:SH3 domain-containing protein n=1 Tax=Streptomyces flaveolus TaxID=67297 RepID=UPI0033ACB907